MIAEVYTAAVAPTRCWECTRAFKKRWIRPTGNCRPAREDRDCGARLEPPLPPLPAPPWRIECQMHCVWTEMSQLLLHQIV